MDRGDTNLPDIKWKDESIEMMEGNQYIRPINNTFIDAFRDIGCQQAVDFPSRLDKTLDIFVTNRPTLINKCFGLPGLSHHDVIIIDTSLTQDEPVKRLIYLWSKADLPGMERGTEGIHALYIVISFYSFLCLHFYNRIQPTPSLNIQFISPMCFSPRVFHKNILR